MRKFLLKLLVRWYIKENREIVKLTTGEEFNLLKFGNPSDVTKLLSSFMTAQTLWHFEAKDKDEQLIVKGAALMLKVLVDSHRTVNKIMEMESEQDKQFKLWSKYKEKKRGLKVH